MINQFDRQFGRDAQFKEGVAEKAGQLIQFCLADQWKRTPTTVQDDRAKGAPFLGVTIRDAPFRATLSLEPDRRFVDADALEWHFDVVTAHSRNAASL
jgi:hypothetical protein